MSKEILKMENISKAFSGVQALNHVNFSCEKGEVHVLAEKTVQARAPF